MLLSKHHTKENKEFFRYKNSIFGKQSQRNSEISDYETYYQQERKFLRSVSIILDNDLVEKRHDINKTKDKDNVFDYDMKSSIAELPDYQDKVSRFIDEFFIN